MLDDVNCTERSRRRRMVAVTIQAMVNAKHAQKELGILT